MVNCGLMYAPSKAVLKAAEEGLAGDLARLDAETRAATSDVTLVCGDGGRVPAHRLMLAARSDVFAAMFRHKGETLTRGQWPLRPAATWAMRSIE